MSHVDPFNAVGGFSVGIPPELVIDENGNVVNNVNAPNSNVTANRVFANGYFYANGDPLSIGASGSNRQVQYNNNGLLGASAAFTFNSTTNLLSVTNLAVSGNANLGNVATVKIAGGTNGYFLQTDGTGNLTWAPAGNGGGGNGSPAGANTQVQFNNQGNFGGDPGFTYDSVANVLTVQNITVGNIAANYIVSNWDVTANVVIANYLYGDGSNITNVHAVTAAIANTVAGANVTGQVNFAAVANSVAGSNVTGQVNFANVANNVAGANVSGQVGNALVAGTVYTAAQPNITSVGNLTSLTVIGNTNLGNQVTSNFFVGNLFGVANLARNVTLNAQPNITSVGTLTSLTVSGTTTLGNTVTANHFVGNLFGVANSAIIANTANIANLANTANLANAAVLAGTVTVNAQPNITSVGTLTSLSIAGNLTTGNANLGNLAIANFITGTLTTAAQPNITSVGTLTGLTVNGNLSATNLSGNGSGLTNIQGANIVGVVPTATHAYTANLANTVIVAAQPNITSVGTLTNLAVSGNVTASNFIGNFIGNISNANFAAFAGNVVTAAQPNITSVGTLTNLTVSGNITTNGLIGNIITSSQPNITALGTLIGLSVNGTANLGSVANVKIFGGTNGYVLSTDGTGNLSWTVNGNGGGNGTPGGSNTQIQFNDSGSFAGNSNFTWNNQTRQLTVNGNATINTSLFSPNIVGTTANFVNASVTGNITAGNVSGGNLVSANFLSGTLTTATQLGINYVGNLGWLNVNTSVPNSNGNITFNGSMSGVGAASNITITGNLNAGNFVEAENLIGVVRTSAQPYISSLGNLSSLTVTGLSNLGNVGNFKLLGGSNGFVLSTDGTGNLNWVAQSGGGGNTSPGGLNTYIQFNDNGTFGGDNTLTWNKNTDTLFVGGNANINGVVTSQTLVSNIATGSPPIVVTSTTPVANLAVDTAATVRSNAQPNITSVGTLTSLAVSGNLSTANLSVTNTFNASNISATGTIGTTNLNVTGTANLTGNTNVLGSGTLTINTRINAAGSSNVNLGNISNIHISGGINGYVLATDGSGNLYWSAGGGGGNGNPGGSNTQVQYNNNGSFAGSSFFTFNESTNNVQIAGNLIANSLTMGAGVYQFSKANVYFATTSSDTPNQPILSIEAGNVAAVDYTIISTDSAAGIRNFVKVSTVIYGNVVNYVEYSTLPVNGYIGDFTVSYDPGSILSPATIQLRLSPQTANSMVHKIMVTSYND